jgi:hypothetical protein
MAVVVRNHETQVGMVSSSFSNVDDRRSGNAMSVARTVILLERAGAAGIQIEDQLEVKPKLSSPLPGPWWR